MANNQQDNMGLVKKIVGVVLAAAILFVAWYGNWLPLAKSQAFIFALQNLQNVHSLDEFEATISKPLDMQSPIGQEELVRNAANTVVTILQQTNDPKLVDDIMKYIGGYYAPIIARGKGMSFEQDLYLLGTMNEISFAKTHETQYLQAADQYYSEGLVLGPKRPQFLYGMFDIDRTEGNVQGTVQVAQQIIAQWGDVNIQQALDQYMMLVVSSTKKTGK